MTLHSISINYPQNPSPEDKTIVDIYMTKFGECITCNNCKDHFKRMFASYKRKYPQWNSSKYELFLFVCRAHNTVNKRIDKPIIGSVSDCLQTIKNNSKNTSLSEFRKKYISYLIGNWSKYRDFEAVLNQSTARELEKINNSYWNVLETDISELELEEGNVAEFITDGSAVQSFGQGFPNLAIGKHVSVGFKFKGGKLSLIGQ